VSALSALPSLTVTETPKNLIGLQVRKWRTKKGWSQEALATKLQLRGWSVSRDSLASLESQRRRVPDCEMLYLARVLGVRLEDLFPRNLPLSKIGAQFQSGGKFAIFPTRTEK
jgi:transcriptional regulator with XRE-family HTH domain